MKYNLGLPAPRLEEKTDLLPSLDVHRYGGSATVRAYYHTKTYLYLESPLLQRSREIEWPLTIQMAEQIQ